MLRINFSMKLMLTYQEYLDLLNNKNVQLFDFQKRISYFRLNNLYKEQSGGGFNESKTIFNLESHNLEKLIISLNYNDLKNAKNIIKLFC